MLATIIDPRAGELGQQLDHRCPLLAPLGVAVEAGVGSLAASAAAVRLLLVVELDRGRILERGEVGPLHPVDVASIADRDPIAGGVGVLDVDQRLLATSSSVQFPMALSESFGGRNVPQ
jgi:hypothetical protein